MPVKIHMPKLKDGEELKLPETAIYNLPKGRMAQHFLYDHVYIYKYENYGYLWIDSRLGHVSPERMAQDTRVFMLPEGSGFTVVAKSAN